MCSELGKGWEHPGSRLRELGGAQLREKEAQADLLALHSSPTGGGSQAAVGLWSQGMRDRKRENGLKLCHRRFRFGIRENFFTQRVVRSWHRLLWAVVKSSWMPWRCGCGTW